MADTTPTTGTQETPAQDAALTLSLNIPGSDQLDAVVFTQDPNNPGNLIATLPGGEQQVFVDYIALAQANLPPALSLADGTVVSGEEITGLIENLNFDLLAPAAGQTGPNSPGAGAGFTQPGDEILGDSRGGGSFAGGAAPSDDGSSRAGGEGNEETAFGTFEASVVTGEIFGGFEDGQENANIGEDAFAPMQLILDIQPSPVSAVGYVEIANIPAGATIFVNDPEFDNGTFFADGGSLVLPYPIGSTADFTDLFQVFIQPPEDSDVDFDLDVTVHFTGPSGTVFDVEATVPAIVDAVADMPVVDAVNAEGGVSGAGVVGYYDMSSGQGVAAQVDSINAAGGTPVQLFDLSAAELSGINTLYVQDPYGSAAEYMSQVAAIHAAVNAGMTLIIHDREPSDANNLLPGGLALDFRDDFSEGTQIEIVDDAGPLASGPGGVIDDSSLDNGNWSNHGYIMVDSLPEGAEVLLTTNDPSHVVTFAYDFGAGTVVYSTIPLDYYLSGNGPADVPVNMEIYAANLLAAAAGSGEVILPPSNTPESGSDEPGSSTFDITISASFDDVTDGSEHHLLFARVPDGWTAVGGSSGYQDTIQVTDESFISEQGTFPKTLAGFTDLLIAAGLETTDISGLIAVDASTPEDQPIDLPAGASYAVFYLTAEDMTSNEDSETSPSYTANVTLTLEAPDRWDMVQEGEEGSWAIDAEGRPEFLDDFAEGGDIDSGAMQTAEEGGEQTGVITFTIPTWALAVDVPTDAEMTFENNLSLVEAGTAEVTVDPVHGQLYLEDAVGFEDQESGDDGYVYTEEDSGLLVEGQLIIEPATANNILFVSDSGVGGAIADVLEGDGHTVTRVMDAFSGGDVPALSGDLSAYGAIFWSASGNSSGDQHTNSTMFANLEAYVAAGGRVFVTGYDSIASPGDPQLIAFLGGTGSSDFGSPNTGTSGANALTTGVIDIQGVQPTGYYGDTDTLYPAEGTETVVGSSYTGGASWTLRDLGAGEIAYVSNGMSGSSGSHGSWTNTADGGDGAYNAAIRNFAFNAVGENGQGGGWNYSAFTNDTGVDEGPIALTITFDVPDNELVTRIEIAGVPARGEIIDTLEEGDEYELYYVEGDDEEPGIWVIENADGIDVSHLNGLSYIPPQHSDVDPTLTVTATFVDPDTGHTLLRSGDINVTVDAVADQAQISLVGHEQQGPVLEAAVMRPPMQDEYQSDSSVTRTYTEDHAEDDEGDVTEREGEAGWTNLSDDGFNYIDTVDGDPSYNVGFSARVTDYDGSESITEIKLRPGANQVRDRFELLQVQQSSEDNGFQPETLAQENIWLLDGTPVTAATAFTVDTDDAPRVQLVAESVTVSEDGTLIITFDAAANVTRVYLEELEIQLPRHSDDDVTLELSVKTEEVPTDGEVTTANNVTYQHATIQLNVEAVADGAGIDTSAQRGGVLELDGTNFLRGEIDVSEGGSGSEGYTSSFWFNTTETGVGLFSVIDFQDNNLDDDHDRHLYLDAEGNIRARVWSNETIDSNDTNYADGQWHHVAHVLDGVNQIIYVDGVEVARGDKGISNFDWQNDILIGRSADAAVDNFTGQMADVQIYDAALSAEEVQALMEGEIQDALALHYNFEGGAPLVDVSGNGHNAIEHGAPAYGEAGPTYAQMLSALHTEDAGVADAQGAETGHGQYINLDFTANLVDQDGSEIVSQIVIALGGADEAAMLIGTDGVPLSSDSTVALMAENDATITYDVSIDGQTVTLTIQEGSMEAARGQDISLDGAVRVELPHDDSTDFDATFTVTTTEAFPEGTVGDSGTAADTTHYTTETTVHHEVLGVVDPATGGFSAATDGERVREGGEVTYTYDEDMGVTQGDFDPGNLVKFHYSAEVQDTDGSEGITKILLAHNGDGTFVPGMMMPPVRVAAIDGPEPDLNIPEPDLYIWVKADIYLDGQFMEGVTLSVRTEWSDSQVMLDFEGATLVNLQPTLAIAPMDPQPPEEMSEIRVQAVYDLGQPVDQQYDVFDGPAYFPMSVPVAIMLPGDDSTDFQMFADVQTTEYDDVDDRSDEVVEPSSVWMSGYDSEDPRSTTDDSEDWASQQDVEVLGVAETADVDGISDHHDDHAGPGQMDFNDAGDHGFHADAAHGWSVNEPAGKIDVDFSTATQDNDGNEQSEGIARILLNHDGEGAFKVEGVVDGEVTIDGHDATVRHMGNGEVVIEFGLGYGRPANSIDEVEQNNENNPQAIDVDSAGLTVRGTLYNGDDAFAISLAAGDTLIVSDYSAISAVLFDQNGVMVEGMKDLRYGHLEFTVPEGGAGEYVLRVEDHQEGSTKYDLDIYKFNQDTVLDPMPVRVDEIDLSGVVSVKLHEDDSTDFAINADVQTVEFDDNLGDVSVRTVWASTADGQRDVFDDNWAASQDVEVLGVADRPGSFFDLRAYGRDAEDGQVVIAEDRGNTDGETDGGVVVDVHYTTRTRDDDGAQTSEGISRILLNKTTSDGDWWFGQQMVEDGDVVDVTVTGEDGQLTTHEATLNLNNSGQVMTINFSGDVNNIEAVTLSGQVTIHLPGDDSTDFVIRARSTSQEFDDDPRGEIAQEFANAWSSLSVSIEGVAETASTGFARADYTYDEDSDGLNVPTENVAFAIPQVVDTGSYQTDGAADGGITVDVSYSASTQDDDGQEQSEGITQIVLLHNGEGRFNVVDGDGNPVGIGETVNIDGAIATVSRMNDQGLLLTFEDQDGEPQMVQSVDLSGVVQVLVGNDDSTDFTISADVQTTEYDDDGAGSDVAVASVWTSTGEATREATDFADTQLITLRGVAETAATGFDEEMTTLFSEDDGETDGAEDGGVIVDVAYSASTQDDDDVHQSEGITLIVLQHNGEGYFNVVGEGEGTVTIGDAIATVTHVNPQNLVLSFAGPQMVQSIDLSGVVQVVVGDDDSTDFTISADVQTTEYDDDGTGAIVAQVWTSTGTATRTGIDFADTQEITLQGVVAEAATTIGSESERNAAEETWSGMVDQEEIEGVAVVHLFEDAAGTTEGQTEADGRTVNFSYTARTQDQDGSEGLNSITLAMRAPDDQTDQPDGWWIVGGTAVEGPGVVMSNPLLEVTANEDGTLVIAFTNPNDVEGGFDIGDLVAIGLPKDDSTDFLLSITTETQEFDDDNDGNAVEPATASVTDHLFFDIQAVMDPVSVELAPTVFNEDDTPQDSPEMGLQTNVNDDDESGDLAPAQSIPVAGTVSVTDTDGSEYINDITISMLGAPAGAQFVITETGQVLNLLDTGEVSLTGYRFAEDGGAPEEVEITAFVRVIAPNVLVLEIDRNADIDQVILDGELNVPLDDHWSGEFGLVVTARGVENSDDTTDLDGVATPNYAIGVDTTAVEVAPISDKPWNVTIEVDNSTPWYEGEAAFAPFNEQVPGGVAPYIGQSVGNVHVTANFTDVNDGSEGHIVVVTIPAGFIPGDQYPNGYQGSVTPQQDSSYTLTYVIPQGDADGVIEFVVDIPVIATGFGDDIDLAGFTVDAIAADGSADVAVTSARDDAYLGVREGVTIANGEGSDALDPEAPTWVAEDQVIDIPLVITQQDSLSDTETVNIVMVQGIPFGAILSDGTNSWMNTGVEAAPDINGWDYGSLTLTLPPNSDQDVTLRVDVATTEAITGLGRIDSHVIYVAVDAVVGEPTVNLNTASIPQLNEGGVIAPMTVEFTLGDPTDTNEIHTLTLLTPNTGGSPLGVIDPAGWVQASPESYSMSFIVSPTGEILLLTPGGAVPTGNTVTIDPQTGVGSGTVFAPVFLTDQYDSTEHVFSVILQSMESPVPDANDPANDVAVAVQEVPSVVQVDGVAGNTTVGLTVTTNGPSSSLVHVVAAFDQAADSTEAHVVQLAIPTGYGVTIFPPLPVGVQLLSFENSVMVFSVPTGPAGLPVFDYTFQVAHPGATGTELFTATALSVDEASSVTDIAYANINYDFVDVGTEGADSMVGTAGADMLLGLGGNDSLFGLDGNDLLAGGEGDDTLLGGEGADVLLGENGNDVLYGEGGADNLNGGAGSDVLSGGSGNDTLTGGTGNDVLYAGSGTDNLSGEGGNDTLVSGDGTDVMSGGTGNDTFVISGGAGAADVITDFSQTEDTLNLDALFDSLGAGARDVTPVAAGADTILILGPVDPSSHMVVLQNLSLDQTEINDLINNGHIITDES